MEDRGMSSMVSRALPTLAASLFAMQCSPGNTWTGGTWDVGPRPDAGGADAAPPQPDGRPTDGGGPTPEPDADAHDGGEARPDGAPDVGPNYDAFFAEDPAPDYCGPEDRPRPDPPGGTPECPDDKNREGCPCDVDDGSAECWPGLRVDRNRGVCRDGVAECVPFDEFGYGRWGSCEGYVLPVDGATRGAEACNCFSAGRWDIDNLSPCFIEHSSGQVCAVSTFLDATMTAHCPTGDTWPPEPEAGYSFSPNRLLVDCSGEFRLCLTLRAGDGAAPVDTDCVLAETCTEGWFDAPEDGVPDHYTEFPDLEPWSNCDARCVRRFIDEGGYAEMSVVGLSEECEEVGTTEEPLIFNVITYCPLYCNEPAHADDPECERCGNGASGDF